jgi:hypothetical protein
MTYNPGMPVDPNNLMPVEIYGVVSVFAAGRGISDQNPQPVKVVTGAGAFLPGKAISDTNPLPVAVLSGSIGGGTGPSPSISFSNDVVVTEGDSGSKVANFILNLARDGYTGPVNFSYSAVGSGANPANPSDFVGGVYPAGSGTFAAGETQKLCPANVAGDTNVEPNENFTMTAAASFATALTSATAIGQIDNDDASVAVYAISGGGAQNEGNTGFVTWNLDVARSGNTTIASTINYATAGATANPATAADFENTAFPSGTLTYAASETTKRITFRTVANTITQQSRGFVVTISGPSPAGSIATATASGTIVDDDSGGALVISRPAVKLTQFWNLWGDSTMFGVGSGTGEDIGSQIRSKLTAESGTGAGSQQFHGSDLVTAQSSASRTAIHVGNGGQGGRTTIEIRQTVEAVNNNATYGAIELARPQFWGGGLNNFLGGATGFSDPAQLNYGKAYESLMKSDLAAEIALIRGNQPWLANLTMFAGSDFNGAETIGNMWPSYQVLKRDLLAAYNGRVLDFRRLLVDEWDRTASVQSADKTLAGADYYIGHILGNIPPQLRPANSLSHAANPSPPILYTGTGTFPTLDYAEGQIAFNLSSNVFLKKEGASGTGQWLSIDDKHFNARANTILAEFYIQAMMAIAGDGPPFMGPQDLYIAVNAANGATGTTLKFLGTPTSVALTTDKEGTALSTKFSCDATGVVSKIGALTEGFHSLYVWSTNALGTTRSILDIFVGRAAGSIVARTFAMPLGDGAIQMRNNHAFGAGQKFSFAGMVKFDTLANNPYLFYLHAAGRGGGAGNMYCYITSLGKFYIQGADGAGSGFAATIGSSGITVPSGQWVWIQVALDFDAGTGVVGWNDTIAAVTAFTPKTMDLSASVINIFGAAQYQWNQNLTNKNMKGSFGPQIMWNSYVDFSQAAVRRQLFAADTTPVARAAYDAVAGAVPQFDTSAMGLGDLCYGAAKPGVPANFVIGSHTMRRTLTAL